MVDIPEFSCGSVKAENGSVRCQKRGIRYKSLTLHQ